MPGYLHFKNHALYLASNPPKDTRLIKAIPNSLSRSPELLSSLAPSLLLPHFSE